MEAVKAKTRRLAQLLLSPFEQWTYIHEHIVASKKQMDDGQMM